MLFLIFFCFLCTTLRVTPKVSLPPTYFRDGFTTPRICLWPEHAPRSRWCHRPSRLATDPRLPKTSRGGRASFSSLEKPLKTPWSRTPAWCGVRAKTYFVDTWVDTVLRLCQVDRLRIQEIHQSASPLFWKVLRLVLVLGAFGNPACPTGMAGIQD